MIIALEGILVSREVDYIVVKAGPVSLQVFIPGSTLDKLGVAGDMVYLHTHFHVKEDSMTLYGFASIGELSLFENLISVSGIGPKVALGLLSASSPEQLVSAIVNGDIDFLNRVPGIGKKTAGRIVLELKGKLEKGWEGTILPALTQDDADVVAALTSLGYSLREATQAASSLAGSGELELEEKIRLALKQLATM